MISIFDENADRKIYCRQGKAGCHLVIHFAKGRRHLVGERPSNDHNVTLPRTWPEDDSKAIQVISCGTGVHHLHCTASCKAQEPQAWASKFGSRDPFAATLISHRFTKTMGEEGRGQPIQPMNVKNHCTGNLVLQQVNLPSPKVMGHIEPSRAQFTNASTFETTNSAAGLADAALDVDT